MPTTQSCSLCPVRKWSADFRVSYLVQMTCVPEEEHRPEVWYSFKLITLRATTSGHDTDMRMSRTALPFVNTSFSNHGSALTWFKSYFSNRHHHVAIWNAKSPISLSTNGLQQGFVLGPVRFSPLYFTYCRNQFWAWPLSTAIRRWRATIFRCH